MFDPLEESKIIPATQDRSYESFYAFLKAKLELESTNYNLGLMGYKLDSFTHLADCLDGIQPGLYIIGAETNVGKTAFLTNIFLDALLSNKTLTGIYISLDDNKNTITNRLLAMISGLGINDVKRPKLLTLEQRASLEFAYQTLFSLAQSGRIDIRDAASIKSVEELEETISDYITTSSQLLVCIDGIYNLPVKTLSGLREESIFRANKLKLLSDMYNIPLIVTAEVRKRPARMSDTKTQQNIPPTIDDLMESSKFAYNAHVIWILHPEDWDTFKSSPEPILDVYFEKNKLSSFKGSSKLQFIKNQGKLIEFLKQVPEKSCF